MPHVIVKLYAGKTEEQKHELAEAVTKALMSSSLNYAEKSVSVAIEEIAQERWAEDVYKPDILESAHIYKKPGYDPFA